MIQDHHRVNLKTLELASSNGHLALMECKDAKTGETVIAVCATHWEDDECIFTPLAKMFNDNPYEELIPCLDEDSEALN